MASFLRGVRILESSALFCSRGRRRFSSKAEHHGLVEQLRPGEVGMISGIPEPHLRRRVVIYSPARTASQQGSGKVGKWKIDFLSTQKWENPLMGWTSTGDPYANVGEAGLCFDTEAAAKAFAEKYGWDYTVRKFHAPLLKVRLTRVVNDTGKMLLKNPRFSSLPKSYADNFKWKGPPRED